jgi:flagellar hook-length control protein FliK
MKIDLSLAPLDKDGPARASANPEADRGVLGDAFGRAVRDAEGKRSANSNDRTSKADVEAPEPAANDAAPVDPEDADDAASEDKHDLKADQLQALLGSLAAVTSAKAAAKLAKQVAKEHAKADGETKLSLDRAGQKVAIAEEAQGKTKGGMKLDVLRMETHFEPHQDGMVLVEGKAGAKDEATPVVDAKSKGAAPGALSAALADIAKGRVGDGKSAAGDVAKGAADDGASPPMRFDEALARLGRGASDGSGREAGRDGSAAAKSALSELADRRSAARSADAASGTVSIASPLPSSSPYNLAGQVAGPIMEALGDPAKAPAQSAPASSDAHLRMRAGGGALKTLTIQLHPEHLGTVDVSMRLNEGRLTLELAASRSDTASMLLDDQASLRKLLEHAGFSLDDAAISVITRDNGQLQTADAGATSSHQNEHGGRPTGEGRPDGRAPSGGSDDPSGRRRSASSNRDDAAPAKSQAGSTYL